MKWLEDFQNKRRLNHIRKRFGGQENLAPQCRECDYYRLPDNPQQKPRNLGCRYPGDLSPNVFEYHTCLVWIPRTKAHPIRVVCGYGEIMRELSASL